MMRDMLKRWIDDAAQTKDRIAAEVRHARDLGRQAIFGARIASAKARDELDRAGIAIADVADRIKTAKARAR